MFERIALESWTAPAAHVIASVTSAVGHCPTIKRTPVRHAACGWYSRASNLNQLNYSLPPVSSGSEHPCPLVSSPPSVSSANGLPSSGQSCGSAKWAGAVWRAPRQTAWYTSVSSMPCFVLTALSDSIRHIYGDWVKYRAERTGRRASTNGCRYQWRWAALRHHLHTSLSRVSPSPPNSHW